MAAEAREKAEAVEEDRLETAKLCEDMVSDLSASLGELNSRLAVGLKQDDYNSAVGDVRVAYDAIDWDTAPNIYCLTRVGVPLEKAANKYASANSIWSDCISDFDCDYDEDASPKIQKRWLQASKLIDKSSAALTDYQLDSESSD